MTIQDAKKMLFDGDVLRARSHLLEMIDAQPECVRGWLLLAAIATKDEDLELELRAFQALRSLRPPSAFLSSGLAHCLYQSARYQEALAEIDSFAAYACKKKEEDVCVLAELEALKKTIFTVCPEIVGSGTKFSE